MEFLGTKFSVTLGAWRLNFAFGVEEVREEIPAPAMARAHHVIYPRDFSNVR